MKKAIGLILLAAILAVGGFYGMKYYNETYKEAPAYAVVPSQVPKKEQTRDANDKIVPNSITYDYNFDFVKEDGTHQTMHFALEGADVKPFTPGAYIKADISQKRVTKGPNEINKTDVPTNVQDKLAK